jgi:hypothetical protein
MIKFQIKIFWNNGNYVKNVISKDWYVEVKELILDAEKLFNEDI